MKIENQPAQDCMRYKLNRYYQRFKNFSLLSRSLYATVNKDWIHDNENHFLKYYSLDLTNFDSQWVAHQTNMGVLLKRGETR